ncbi:hypothetical protein BZG36_05551 [Bifiguratus adelaidae]|uniref:Uncharacterized protein n=1 Tax=Bifiguratus adelaidae TaxID=1938954 RepID=A0A261XT23_9FUNG|nr:hypothetical protein BZG36_05551 [Bifiguratus adelaidae]
MVRVQELADDQVANLPRTGVPKGTLNHALMTDFDASELEYVSSSMDMSEYDHDTLFTDGLDETDEDVLFIFANMDDNGFDSSLLTEHEQDLLELALFMRRKHISLDMWSYEDNVEGLRVTEPRTGQKVKEGQEVSIVVDRVVNNLGKRIIAVELYEITNAAKKEAKLIEQVGGNHNIRLNHSATLKDKFNVPKGTKLPGTFTYRVWVENDAGPDCTLLSGSFTATK